MIIFIQLEVVHIMLVAVVSRVMVPSVGLSLFVLTLMPLLSTGVLAPPYHLNLYRVIIFLKIEVVLIIYIVVVPQALFSALGLSIFLLGLLLLIPLGIVVLHYHLNLYRVIIFIQIEVVLIILIAVDTRPLVPAVVCFALMHTLPFRILAGIVVLPYHLNLTSDYFYQYKSGTCYANHGGGSSNGVRCGSFCVIASNGAGIANLSLGAALSFKPARRLFVCARRFIVIIFFNIEIVLVMLFVVVAQAMVHTVVLFLFLRTILLLPVPGLVAPPYHLNQIDELLPDVL